MDPVLTPLILIGGPYALKALWKIGKATWTTGKAVAQIPGQVAGAIDGMAEAGANAVMSAMEAWPKFNAIVAGALASGEEAVRDGSMSARAVVRRVGDLAVVETHVLRIQEQIRQ